MCGYTVLPISDGLNVIGMITVRWLGNLMTMVVDFVRSRCPVGSRMRQFLL